MIVIPIEVKAREFQSRLLIAEYLYNKGLKVVLGSERSILYLIDQIQAPFVYFDKSISKNKIFLYENLKARGCRICSIDEEGLSVVNNYKGYTQKRFSKHMLQLVDKVFFWGTIDYSPIVEIYPQYNKKFFITGNPRLIPSKIDVNKRYLCAFISNFTFNHASGESNFWTKLESLGRIPTAKDRVFYETVLRQQERGFNLFVCMIKDVLRNFPKKNFVVRPHPSENPKYWTDLAKDFDNLNVDLGEVKAIETITSASVMVHMGCTTGIESALYGIKTIAYLPEEFESKSLSNKVSHKVSTKEELMVLLRNCDKIESGMIKLSSEVVLGSGISEILGEEIAQLNTSVKDILKVKIGLLNRLKLLLVKYRRLLPTDYGRMEKYEHRKFPGLNLNEITSLSQINGSNIKRLATDVFLLSK